MGEIKNRYKEVKVSTKTNVILDTETGEISEVKNGYLVKKISIPEVSISYKEYVYLDTGKLKILLNKGIKQVELALIVTISANLLNRYNICMLNKDEPLTTASIAKLVGNSVQSVKSKLNRLIKMGVLAYSIMKHNENWGKVYTVNPHFIRIGIVFTDSIPELFNDIKAENNQFN